MRTRLGLVALLFVLAGLAWWATANQMAGMDAGPGTDLGALGWFLGVWVVMMAAMMFPSVAPTVALYARMTRRRRPGRPLLFTAAYLLVWCAAGVLAYGLFELGKSLFGAQLAWDAGGRWLAAGVLVVAAVYELTPLKNVCLAKCRSPLGFLLGSWRDGPARRDRDGRQARRLVRRLLLGAHGGAVRAGRDESRVDGGGRRADRAEKTLPWRRPVVWADDGDPAGAGGHGGGRSAFGPRARRAREHEGQHERDGDVPLGASLLLPGLPGTLIASNRQRGLSRIGLSERRCGSPARRFRSDVRAAAGASVARPARGVRRRLPASPPDRRERPYAVTPTASESKARAGYRALFQNRDYRLLFSGLAISMPDRGHTTSPSSCTSSMRPIHLRG